MCAHNRGRDIRYGAAGFAMGMPTIPLLVHLPAVYAEHIGLGLAVTGLVLFVARGLDVITDPLIGMLTDRLSGRWGPRKPLILLGALVSALSALYLLDPAPGVGPWYLGLWAGALYFGWTLISIPYMAWGADLSADYAGRTRITTIREGFTLGGIVVAGTVPAVAALYGYDERAALPFIAWATIAVGAPLFAVLLLRVPEPRQGHGARPATTAPDWRTVKGLAGNRPFIRLILAWFINSLANGIPAVLFILFMTHVLMADALSRGLLTLAYFLAGIAAMPLWHGLSRRWGKHRAWCAAMVLACVSFAVVPFLGAGDLWLFGVICLLTGAALGADLALPPAMQADVVDYERFRSGRDATGTLFALWSMIVKLATAGAVIVAFPSLEALGFDPAGPITDQGRLALALLYAALPVVLKLIAIALVWGFPLTRRRQRSLQRVIARANAHSNARANARPG